LKERRRTAELVASSDFRISPLERRKRSGFFIERLRHELERRKLSHGSVLPQATSPKASPVGCASVRE